MLRQNPACMNRVFLPFFRTRVFSERLSPALWSLQFLFLRHYIYQSHIPSSGRFFDFFHVPTPAIGVSFPHCYLHLISTNNDCSMDMHALTHTQVHFLQMT